jgi:PAS domain-containing protein
MPSVTTRITPEQLYRLLADNATDVVTLHDLAGRYLYVSPSMADAIVSGGIVTLEYRFRDAEGGHEWVETTARSVGDEIQSAGRRSRWAC